MKKPKISLSQKIGEKAGRVFQTHKPDNWLVNDLDGDNDFGLDYVIQLIGSSDELLTSFYL